MGALDVSEFESVLRTSVLSPHLSLREFLGSRDHPDLVPENIRAFLASPEIRANALRLARGVFEPARRLLGPLKVSSGFRCDALNRAVGGAGYLPGQKPSAHLVGRAIDVEPVGLSLREAMARLIANSSEVPFEKAIFERGTWLHLQVPRADEPARHAALMWFGGSDYLPFKIDDPRVRSVA